METPRPNDWGTWGESPKKLPRLDEADKAAYNGGIGHCDYGIEFDTRPQPLVLAETVWPPATACVIKNTVQVESI